SSDKGRRMIEILWASCITIFLCCWVSTYPNVGSRHDKWYFTFYDKLSFFTVAILGPDFLFGIAIGQFSSARRSVKVDKHLCNGTRWTHKYAFFADMGGIHLIPPDYPDGFPINAEQLHYLVLHKHVEFPDMRKMEIEERNSVDTLSRIITVFQVFFFSVTEIQRVRLGLPMTTLELMALSFSFVMIATSMVWYLKPSIRRPRFIETTDRKTAEEIRQYAKQHTHPDMDTESYRTPLDFVGRDRFRINAHWNYYISLCRMLHVYISRSI
ncbi:hypothetical protein GQ53DRAFT_597647, partial [Thozetella sp. PMI_491]